MTFELARNAWCEFLPDARARRATREISARAHARYARACAVRVPRIHVIDYTGAHVRAATTYVRVRKPLHSAEGLGMAIRVWQIMSLCVHVV